MNHRFPVIASALACCMYAAQAATPPNFIFILCDDLGYNDLGCYTYPSKANPGPPPPPAPTSYHNIPAPNCAYDAARPDQTITPHIDRLATEGVRFRNFHTSPVCSASRASLLTGCYAPRVGIVGVLAYDDTKGLNTAEVTLPEQLKNAGYATACIGKWHLGHHPQFLPTRQGFDEFFGLPYSHNMANLWLHENETPVENISGDVAKLTLLTQQYTTRALDFIERNQSKPFLLYLAHGMPHIPTYATAAFAGASGKGSFYDSVMEIDWSVGQIMAKLQALHLDTNTLVIFTSDNGPWQSAANLDFAARAVGSAYPLRDAKTTSWEGGVRVPFIARWAGKIPAGSATGAIAGLVDIMPTLTKLANSAPPTDRVIDGGDIWPILSSQPGAVSPHSRYYIYDGAALEAVLDGAWKLRETGAASDLFNLDLDIQEQTNVKSANLAIYTQLRGYQTTFADALNAAKRPVGVYSAQEIILSTNQLAVPDGHSASFQIKLAQQPSANTTVNVERFSGSSSFAISGPTAFTFTTSNWNTFQTVTISSATNSNPLVPGASFRCSSPSFQPVRKVFASPSAPVVGLPTISAVSNRTIEKGKATPLIPLALSDEDTDVALLTLSAATSNTNLVPAGNIVFGGSGSNRSVVVAPAAGKTGSAQITLTVHDGTFSASSSFALTVVDSSNEPSLVGRWTFDDQSLANTGSSGSAHDGTFMAGATPATAPYSTNTRWGVGYALDATSLASFMRINNSASGDANYANTFDAPSAFSISLWIKRPASGEAWASFAQKTGTPGTTETAGWVMRKNGTSATNTIAQLFHAPAPVAAVAATTTVSDQAWHHLVMTYDGATLTYYIDSAPIGSVADTFAAKTTAALLFGAQNGSGLRSAQAYYDDIRFYDSALTASQIDDLFNNEELSADPYESWTGAYGLSGSNAAFQVDVDGDRLSNLQEYALGGDPAYAADTGHAPTSGTIVSNDTLWFNYVHPQRRDANSGITYTVQVSDALAATNWTTAGIQFAGSGVLNDDFDLVTNRISAEIKDEQFIRLRIEPTP